MMKLIIFIIFIFVICVIIPLSIISNECINILNKSFNDKVDYLNNECINCKYKDRCLYRKGIIHDCKINNN